MKNIMKIFSVIAVGAALLFASCKVAGIEPSPKIDGVYISSVMGGASMSVSADSPSFTVPVMRTNKTGSVTASLTYESEKLNLLSGMPASVTFADGQDRQDITVNVDIEQIEYDAPFGMTITVNDNNTPYGLNVAIFNIVKPLIWEAWANVTWSTTVNIFTNPIPPTPMVLEKARGVNLFRFPGIYDDAFEYRFEWDINSKSVSIMPVGTSMTYQEVPVIRQAAGIGYDETSSVYWLTAFDPARTFYAPATKILTINSAYYVFNDTTLAGVGGFGWFIDSFEITEFVQGDPWQ